jgi:hypothetical protein
VNLVRRAGSVHRDEVSGFGCARALTHAFSTLCLDICWYARLPVRERRRRTGIDKKVQEVSDGSALASLHPQIERGGLFRTICEASGAMIEACKWPPRPC